MPKFPNYAKKLSGIKGAIFEKFRSKMINFGPDIVRFHIGDSYMPPVYPLPFNHSFLTDNQNFSRYGNTFGVEEIRDVLSMKLWEDNRLKVNPNNILMTTGATNALGLSSSQYSRTRRGNPVINSMLADISGYHPFSTSKSD